VHGRTVDCQGNYFGKVLTQSFLKRIRTPLSLSLSLSLSFSFCFQLSKSPRILLAYLHILCKCTRITIRRVVDGAAECRRTWLIVDVINNTINDVFSGLSEQLDRNWIRIKKFMQFILQTIIIIKLLYIYIFTLYLYITYIPRLRIVIYILVIIWKNNFVLIIIYFLCLWIIFSL